MAERNINTTSGGLNLDLEKSFLKEGDWRYARNAVGFTRDGDNFVLGNEPSNELCVEITYDNKELDNDIRIIGRIHLIDDRWAVFSTENNDPEDGGWSEIGIFDVSKCEYVPVVRSKCLGLSPKHPIRGGISRYQSDCDIKIYWADGYNPDRFMSLGDPEQWPKSSSERGDVMNDEWLGSVNTVPYISEDCDPDENCVQLCAVKPLELDCEKIRLAPKVSIPCVSVKQSNKTGTLPDGIYHIAVAYTDGGERITQYYVSQPCHLFTEKTNSGAIDVSFSGLSDEVFGKIEVVVVSFVNGQLTATRLGEFDANTSFLNITTVPATAERVDISSVVRNDIVYDKSDGIYKVGDYVVRLAPTTKFDFNYQPLANLIKGEWFSAEYPEDYYERSRKSTGASYTIDSDVVGYMRDEVYTFFIRWIYDTGDKSPAFHIPAPPFFPDESGEEPVNNAALTSSANDVCQDGGLVIAKGRPGTFLSEMKYDSRHPERWNWTWFKTNVIKSTQYSLYTLPYSGTTDTDYDLCGDNIRLFRMPDETLSPVVDLYDKSKKKIRMIGVRFSNIYHPLDNYGNPIKGIAGFEILRADREGHQTIIAKGIVNYMYGYNRDKLSDSNDVNKVNSWFQAYPFNSAGEENPFLALEKVYSKATIGKNTTWSIIDGIIDDHDFSSSIRYQNTTDYKKLTFHSPDTNFDKPFTSWTHIKRYYDYKGLTETYYALPSKHPRYKLLSPGAYGGALILAMYSSFLKLNGRYEIETGGHTLEHKDVASSGSVFGDVAQGIILGVKYIGMGMIGLNIISSLSQSGSIFGSSAMMAYNAMGFTLGDFVDTYQGATDVAAIMSALSGSGSMVMPRIRKVQDGLLDGIPKNIKNSMMLPILASTLSEEYLNQIAITSSSVPFRDYVVQGMMHGFYDTVVNRKQGGELHRVKESFYLNSGIFDIKGYYINHLHRTRSLFLDSYTPLLNDSGFRDNSIDSRLYDVCGCDGILGRWMAEDDLRNCREQRDILSPYVALKVLNNVPYGDLHITKKIPVGCIQRISEPGLKYSSDYLFGGDTYVTRYTEKDTFLYFYDYPIEEPDGYEYNYLKYRNILFPRFYINTQFNPFFDDYLVENKDVYCDECSDGSLDDCEKLIAGCWLNADNPTGMFLFMQHLGVDVSQIGTSLIDQFLGCILDILNDVTQAITSFGQSVIDFGSSTVSSGISGFVDSLQDLFDGDGGVISGIVDFFKMIFNLIKVVVGLIAILVGVVVLIIGILLSIAVIILGAIFTMITTFVGMISAIVQSIRNLGKEIEYGKLLRIPYNLDGCYNTACYDTNTLNQVIKKFLSLSANGLWMYLSHSSVRDFWVESKYNMAFRLNGERPWEVFFNPWKDTDLEKHFDIQYLKYGDTFNIDTSLSVQHTVSNLTTWSVLQPVKYDPKKAENCFTKYRNRLIYSLPASDFTDNWRVYLPLNYKDFQDSVVGMRPVGDSGAVILFEHQSPVYIAGVDQLQTTGGIKVTIGDGGLFNQALRRASNSDKEYQYGSCQDAMSFINTPYGLYYVSNTNGKIFAYSQNIEEISMSGLRFWSAEYLPFRALDDFPDFPFTNNTVLGIGMMSVFDSYSGLIYFCKRDFKISDDYRAQLEQNGYKIEYYEYYKDANGEVLYDNMFIVYDPGKPPSDGVNHYIVETFDIYEGIASGRLTDLSVTLSYDPIKRRFISFHDWHPELAIGSESGFATILKNRIWIHGKRCDSYCNFYGEQYPFEVELVSASGLGVEVLRSIEYYLEAYKYGDNCHDKFHDLDYNFDELVVYNTEQCSGLLRIVERPKNDPIAGLMYPKYNNSNVEVVASKEENKYRINQIVDLVKDRGEYSGSTAPFIQYSDNGYVRSLDFYALDYAKPPTERKKFRHYLNFIWLIRRGEMDRKMLVKAVVTKNNASFR